MSSACILGGLLYLKAKFKPVRRLAVCWLFNLFPQRCISATKAMFEHYLTFHFVLKPQIFSCCFSSFDINSLFQDVTQPGEGSASNILGTWWYPGAERLFGSLQEHPAYPALRKPKARPFRHRRLVLEAYIMYAMKWCEWISTKHCIHWVWRCLFH